MIVGKRVPDVMLFNTSDGYTHSKTYVGGYEIEVFEKGVNPTKKNQGYHRYPKPCIDIISPPHIPIFYRIYLFTPLPNPLPYPWFISVNSQD